MRFQCKEESHGAWMVIDTEARRWRLHECAVSLRLSKQGAMMVAEILNREWQNFLENPT